MKLKFLGAVMAFCALGAVVSLLCKSSGLVDGSGPQGAIWVFITVAGGVWAQKRYLSRRGDRN
ncbi:hypothetical protein ABTZ03_41120 [Kitasatospora sp. NPDC096077]|uniref:hypothetical protein n=1 Tax=Kitasatospora sp. NPDC096077 TaxID=3155544 RepID=UPI00332D35D4